MELQSIILALRAMTALQHALKGREVGISLRIGRHDLAIDKACGQSSNGTCHFYNSIRVCTLQPLTRIAMPLT